MANEMRISVWSSDVCSADLFAEPAVYDRLFQILVRGGNDPDVDGLRLVAADALDLAFLQHTKQFYLHVGRHIADFVEEDRAAVGRLEPALAGLERTGERALFMTEQLRFQKLARNGPAVHGDEARAPRSEEHTSEIESLMRYSYA